MSEELKTVKRRERLKQSYRDDAAAKEEIEATQPSHPTHANEEWRRFYAAIREATEQLRQ